MSRKRFYHFPSRDLDTWPLDIRSAPLVALVKSYVRTKLEVPVAFLLPENRRHGRTGR